MVAAPAKYPTPSEQLLDLARDARARGVLFEIFWEVTVRPNLPPITTRMPDEARPPGAIVWPGDTWDRKVWQYGIYQSKEGWRRAYEGEPPTPKEQALAMLSPVLALIEKRGDGSLPDGSPVAVTPSRAA